MRLRLDNNRGFTLIEILVVLALTMMTMGLIFGPLVWSLRMTRSGEIMIRTQDDARHALAMVSRDLSDAMFVYDDTSTEDYVNFVVPNKSGALVPVPVYSTKVDLVLPRMRWFCPVDPNHTPGGITRTDEADPTCPFVDDKGKRCGAALEMRPIQPLTQDTKVVRYFIGLRDPMKPYANGYLTPLAEAGGDNTYVLYRAEFSSGDPALFPDTDLHGNVLTDEGKRRYPDFFNDQRPNGKQNPDGSDQTYCQAWKRISRPVVTLEDVDLIAITYPASPNALPTVTPLVRFAPTAVYNDPLVPTNSGTDSPALADAPPTTYKATYGNWVQTYKVTLTPDPTDPTTTPGVTYETMFDANKDMCIYRIQSGSTDVSVFNITHYMDTRANSMYDAGDMLPVPWTNRERAFTVDRTKGTVNFAFPNVTWAQCDAMNQAVSGSGGNKLSLSYITSTDTINSGLNGYPDTAGNFAINCIDVDGSDPRVLANSTIVPGSVKISAPDDTKRSVGNGKKIPFVDYTCTPYLMRDPDVNQFSVDYHHDMQWDGTPSPGAARIYFHKTRTVEPGLTTGLPPAVNPGSPNVLIYYEVQNNKKGDVLRANYVTKSIMTVIMGIQIWDSGMKKPQVVQFTNKVRLKNSGS